MIVSFHLPPLTIASPNVRLLFIQQLNQPGAHIQAKWSALATMDLLIGVLFMSVVFFALWYTFLLFLLLVFIIFVSNFIVLFSQLDSILERWFILARVL